MAPSQYDRLNRRFGFLTGFALALGRRTPTTATSCLTTDRRPFISKRDTSPSSEVRTDCASDALWIVTGGSRVSSTTSPAVTRSAQFLHSPLRRKRSYSARYRHPTHSCNSFILLSLYISHLAIVLYHLIIQSSGESMIADSQRNWSLELDVTHSHRIGLA